MLSYKDWITQLDSLMVAIEITDEQRKRYHADAGFKVLLAKTGQIRRNAATIFLIGNGASASMASHAAADLAKNGGLKTMTLCEPSMLTAVGNDDGFREVFAQPLRRFGASKDMLVAISSSGQSANILSAIRAAREVGMGVVTFSAMDAENPLQRMGDLNFYIPARTYGFAESAHAALLHYWIDLHIHELAGQESSQHRLHVIIKDAAS